MKRMGHSSRSQRKGLRSYGWENASSDEIFRKHHRDNCQESQATSLDQAKVSFFMKIDDNLLVVPDRMMPRLHAIVACSHTIQWDSKRYLGL